MKTTTAAAAENYFLLEFITEYKQLVNAFETTKINGKKSGASFNTRLHEM